MLTLSCNVILKTRSSAVANMPSKCLFTLYFQHCIPLVAIHWLDYPTHSHSPEGKSWQHIGSIFQHIPFNAFSEVIPLSYWVHIWYGKTKMAGLQCDEGRMMINSVVWAQYINVTDTHTQRRCHSNSRSNALHSGGINWAQTMLCIIHVRRLRWMTPWLTDRQTDAIWTAEPKTDQKGKGVTPVIVLLSRKPTSEVLSE